MHSKPDSFSYIFPMNISINTWQYIRGNHFSETHAYQNRYSRYGPEETEGDVVRGQGDDGPANTRQKGANKKHLFPTEFVDKNRAKHFTQQGSRLVNGLREVTHIVLLTHQVPLERIKTECEILKTGLREKVLTRVHVQ